MTLFFMCVKPCFRLTFKLEMSKSKNNLSHLTCKKIKWGRLE